MTYIKINDVIYAAEITGRLHDHEWDDRESKTIKLEMPVAEANTIFVKGLSWSIVQEDEFEIERIYEETGEAKIVTETNTEEYDNSEFTVPGDIIDHRDGFITVKMGKPTAAELLEVAKGELNAAQIDLDQAKAENDVLWNDISVAYEEGIQEA